MGELPLLDRELRDVLHRAADLEAGLESGALSAHEQVILARLPLSVQRTQQTAWAEATRALTRPALPRSVAGPVASDIALAAQLQLPVVPSVAGAVAAEIALSAELRRGCPGPTYPSLAAAAASEIALSAQLHGAAPAWQPPSSAAFLAARIAHSAGHKLQEHQLQETVPAAGRYTPHPAARRDRRSAPLALVGSLIVGLLLLAITSSWEGLSAGAGVLRGLLSGLTPSFGLGVALLLGTSLLMARSPVQPQPARQALGAAAFAVAALLTLPPLYSTLDSQGVSIGRDVVIEGQRRGPVIVLGGDVRLLEGSVVTGEVFTLLGDIEQHPSAQVSGQTTALLGQGPGQRAPQHTDLSDLQLASATAIRPLLGWLGGAAWGVLFWVLTSALTLALFVSGAAGRLALLQRRAPLRTLALGVLALASLLIPATLLTFAGWLAPALGLCLLLVLLLALGLGVSAFDVGRQLACRLHARVPDTFGVVLALGLLSGAMLWPPATLAALLIGGAWGCGSLLLVGQTRSAQPGSSGGGC